MTYSERCGNSTKFWAFSFHIEGHKAKSHEKINLQKQMCSQAFNIIKYTMAELFAFSPVPCQKAGEGDGEQRGGCGGRSAAPGEPEGPGDDQVGH